MYKRLLFDVVLFSSIFFTPWWVVITLGFFGAFFFPLYYEVILIGAIVDLLYGARTLTLYGVLGTIGAITIFFFAQYAKNRVR